MEVAVELEDDIFFQELSKQISLLIMDEDEEDPLASSSSADSLQSFSGAIYNHHPPPPQSALIFHEQLALRRSQIKGTGVFIPQQSTTQQAQPRRKQRKGRSSSSYAKYQKQSQEEDTRMVSFQPRSGQAGSFCKTS